MSIDKLHVAESFPAEKGQQRIVTWIRDKIYFRISQRVNWLLDRIGNNSDLELIKEGSQKGDDGNWRIRISDDDLVIERKIAGVWSEAQKIHGS